MISSALFVLVILLWGMMLMGIDKAQRHHVDHHANDEPRQSRPEATDGGCYYVVDYSRGVVVDPVVYSRN